MCKRRRAPAGTRGGAGSQRGAGGEPGTNGGSTGRGCLAGRGWRARGRPRCAGRAGRPGRPGRPGAFWDAFGAYFEAHFGAHSSCPFWGGGRNAAKTGKIFRRKSVKRGTTCAGEECFLARGRKGTSRGACLRSSGFYRLCFTLLHVCFTLLHGGTDKKKSAYKGGAHYASDDVWHGCFSEVSLASGARLCLLCGLPRSVWALPRVFQPMR